MILEIIENIVLHLQYTLIEVMIHPSANLCSGKYEYDVGVDQVY